MQKRLLLAAIVLIGLALAACDNSANPASDTKLITLTFDADGGTPAVQTIKIVPGKAIEEFPTQPTNTGYVFFDWYTGKNGEGAMLRSGDAFEQDTTFYADWTTFTITGVPNYAFLPKVYFARSEPANYLESLAAISCADASGTINRDGSIVFDQQSVYLYNSYDILLTSDAGRTISVDNDVIIENLDNPNRIIPFSDFTTTYTSSDTN